MRHPWYHYTYNIPTLKAVSAIAHVRDLYPSITWTQGWNMWKEAYNQPDWDALLQNNTTVSERFYPLRAERQMDLADLYECVHGDCTIEWYNGRNIAGCPCDNLPDPPGEPIRQGSTAH